MRTFMWCRLWTVIKVAATGSFAWREEKEQDRASAGSQCSKKHLAMQLRRDMFISKTLNSYQTFNTPKLKSCTQINTYPPCFMDPKLIRQME